jgi:hypothetical protein
MIIKRIFYAIVLTFLFYSCTSTIDGNGTIKREQREVSSFSKIDISGGYEIMINQGDEEKLELETDENLLEHITTNTKNNTLFISHKKRIVSAKSIKLYLTVVDVEDIDVAGAIELKNKGTYSISELEIDVSGAADIDLDLDVENLKMDMSGASETTLTGKANNFDIEISGAGELDAKKLKTRNTSIDISGAGSAIVFAKKTLKVKVSGAGSVKYKGDPKIDKDISGAGSIEKL